jgi:hypothetical protein
MWNMNTYNSKTEKSLVGEGEDVQVQHLRATSRQRIGCCSIHIRNFVSIDQFLWVDLLWKYADLLLRNKLKNLLICDLQNLNVTV